MNKKPNPKSLFKNLKKFDEFLEKLSAAKPTLLTEINKRTYLQFHLFLVYQLLLTTFKIELK